MTQDNHNFIVEYVNSHPQFNNNESDDMKLNNNNSTTFIYQDHIDLVGFIPNTTTTTTAAAAAATMLPQSPDPYDELNATATITSPSNNFHQQQHFPSPSPSPYHASSKPMDHSTFYPDFFQSYSASKETAIFESQQQPHYGNDFMMNHTSHETKDHSGVISGGQVAMIEETEDLIVPNNRNISSSSSTSSSSSSSASSTTNVSSSVSQPSAAPPPKPGKIVNSELRRQIHIQSEQKRRAQIKDGFEDLRNELPSCLNKKMSKVALLHRTVQHIQHLKNTQMTIYAELERLASENEQLRKFQETVLQKQSLEKIYSSH